MVKQEKFREDFYFRLNVIKLEAPSLKERKEDIPLLISSFLKEFCKENNKPLKTFSKEALKLMIKYDWQGNVRELKNAIENIVVFSKSNIINATNLPENILKQRLTLFPNSKKTLNIETHEKLLIKKALEDCKFNKTKAALKLGMSRRTIHRKVKEYGLNN